jgi:hypothetical protein
MSTTTTSTVQSEFAKRQLERMGWSEGSGLGKDRQGCATPIIVKQRVDVTGGLGIEKEKVRLTQQAIQNEWWKDALGDTLSKLSTNNDKKKKKKLNRETEKTDDNIVETNNKNKKIIFTDEELFIATGGARFGMRAGKTRNQAKWRRTEEQELKLLATQPRQVQNLLNDVELEIGSDMNSVATKVILDMETQTIETNRSIAKKGDSKTIDKKVRKEKKKSSDNRKRKIKDSFKNIAAIPMNDSPLKKKNQQEKKKQKKKTKEIKSITE